MTAERRTDIPCRQCDERLPLDIEAITRHVNERHPVVVAAGVASHARVTESEDALRTVLSPDQVATLLVDYSYIDADQKQDVVTLLSFALAARPSQVKGSQPAYEPHQGPHEYRCVECGADLSQAKAIDLPRINGDPFTPNDSAADLVTENRNSDLIDEKIEKVLVDHLKTWHGG